MVQEQLLDYISSQVKLGVSREAIKSALVSAGWVAGDVDDTLKKVEGSSATPAAAAQPAAVKPMQTASMGASVAASSSVAKTSEPQMIKVGDLVSSPFSGSKSSSSMPAGKSDSITAMKLGGTIKGNSFVATPAGGSVAQSSSGSGSKKGMILGIVAVILILGLGGVAWYFYSGNASLAAQITSLNGQSASVTSQLNSLQAQIAASSTSQAASISQLTTANADLALDLSFFAVPIGTPSAAASEPLPVTLSGSISTTGKVYAVTTPRGAKIYISNSSDVKIGPELKALVGQTAQLEGTYVQGSDEMTVATATSLTSMTPSPTSSPATASSTP